MTKIASTTLLWDTTHAALCGKQWGEARGLLEQLSRRDDIVDLLPNAKAYGVPDMLHSVIQDRIDEVNAAVARRATLADMAE